MLRAPTSLFPSHLFGPPRRICHVTVSVYLVCTLNKHTGQLMNDMSFRLNQQKTKHAEELRESALCITALEQELRQVLVSQPVFVMSSM